MDSFVVAPVSPKKWGNSLCLDACKADCKALDEDTSPVCSSSELSELTTLASSDSEALSGCSEGEWEESELQQMSQVPETKVHVAEEVDMPPPPQAQTQRTQLRSKASLFVPRVTGTTSVIVPAPQAMPALCTGSDEDLVPEVIRQAFGPFLKKLTVKETPLSTSVRVELQDVPQYAPELETHEQLARSKSMQCLTMALTTALGPKLFGLSPSADESRLSFEYFKMGTSHLCWEFLNHCCARGGHCRWEHAVAQAFIVALILPPPADPNHRENSQLLPKGSGLVAPVLPLQSKLTQQAGQDLVTHEASCNTNNASGEAELSSPMGSGSRTPSSRIAWADLEDSDEDLG